MKHQDGFPKGGARKVLAPRADDREMVEAILTGYFVGGLMCGSIAFPKEREPYGHTGEEARFLCAAIERAGYTFVRLRKPRRRVSPREAS